MFSSLDKTIRRKEMNDKITSDIPPIRCTHCGSESIFNVQYVACVSETTYTTPEKDRAIQTAGLVSLAKAISIVHLMKDNLEIWTIASHP